MSDEKAPKSEENILLSYSSTKVFFDQTVYRMLLRVEINWLSYPESAYLTTIAQNGLKLQAMGQLKYIFLLENKKFYLEKQISNRAR